MTELKRVTKLAWRKHLLSEHGVEGMLALRERTPSIGGGGEAHQIIFQAGKAQGFVDAINAIYEIASANEERSISDLETP